MSEDGEGFAAALVDVADPLALFEDLFRHAPVGVQLYDADGRSILTNPAFRAMFGAAPPPEYVIFDDNLLRERGILDLVRRAFAGETIETPPVWYDARDLTNVDVKEARRVAISATFLPVRGRSGAVTHVAFVFRDVTELLSAREAAERAQAAAERERDLLRAIVEQSHDAILVADAEGVLRIFNPAAERLHGVARRDVPAAEWQPTFGLRDLDGGPLPLPQIPLWRAVHGEVVAEARWVVARPDGTRRTLQGSATPLRAADGAPAGGVLVARDVSEQRELEEALRAGEALFRRIFEAGVVGIAFTDDDTRLLDANQAFLDMIGYGRDEILTGRLTWKQLTPPEWLDVSLHALERLRATGIAPTFEKEYVRKDGSRVPVLVTSARVVEQQRNVTLVLDISPSKALEEQLRFLSEASRVLSGSLDPDVTLRHLAQLATSRLATFSLIDVVQPDGSFVRATGAHRDPTMERRLLAEAPRYPPSNLPGSPYADVVARKRTQVVPDFAAVRARVARGPEHLALMEALAARAVLLVPIIVRDEMAGIITLAATGDDPFDADDVEMAEELARRAAQALENARLYHRAREAITVRDEFLSIASHELKTPLSAMELTLSAFLRAAAIGRADAGALDKARRLQTQVDRLNRLVHQLLDVTRITGGRLALERAVADVGDVVDQVVGRFADEAARTSTSLGCAKDGDLRAVVDADRLDQVVTNLVGNALKFGAGKPVQIAVAGVGALVRIAVTDQGAGVGAGEQARIFERFERAASARHFGGMGLGLWISKQIVEAHGGSIRVQSAAGEGATFVVELPRGDVTST